MKFTFYIYETRAYLNTTDWADHPFVTVDQRTVASADSAKEMVKKIEEFVAEAKATVVECFSESDETVYLKLDLTNLVLECHINSKSQISAKDLELFETLEGLFHL